MTIDPTLTSLTKKVKNFKVYQFSGRTPRIQILHAISGLNAMDSNFCGAQPADAPIPTIGQTGAAVARPAVCRRGAFYNGLLLVLKSTDGEEEDDPI